VEAQRWFAEIKLRACVKIGELSRDLPHGKTGPKPSKLDDIDVAQFDKEAVLQRTGIGIRTAERYEELAGSRADQATQIASAAMETYFAHCAEEGQEVSMRGLRTAVFEAAQAAGLRQIPRPKAVRSQPNQ
jgi:hypothetical protein